MSDTTYTPGQQITVRGVPATVFAQTGNAVVISWNDNGFPGVVTIDEIDKEQQSS